MAFSNRIGSALKQALSKRIIPDLSLSNSSMYQAFRSMSSSKLFVGGLSYGTDETSLKEAFNQYGDLVDVRIIMDRETGRSRGFGFVSFTSTESATAAMQNLDGQDLHGRRIKVNYATEKPRGGFGGGGDGYAGGGNYNSGYSGGGGNYNSGYSSGGGNYNSGYPSGGNYNSGYTGADNYNSGYSSGGGNYNSGGGGGYNSNFAATQETNFNDKNENFTASSGNFNGGFANDGNYATNTGLEEAGGYNVGQQQMNMKQEGAEFVKDDLKHSNSLDDGNYRDDDDDDDDDDANGFANTRG
ncbi:unnamed protein product [Cuscuta epithymum]|uniref:RRM domain-containing protein n=1 Tax=Cuscuta epithymum TaxID=186058 RepID=A0AAV0EA33_9ASTE|nr:unnamed protein product [Cuscuta epithymum]